MPKLVGAVPQRLLKQGGVSMAIECRARVPNKEQFLIAKISSLLLAGRTSINVRAMCEDSGVPADRGDSLYTRALAIYSIMRDEGFENPGAEDGAHILSVPFRLQLADLAMDLDNRLAVPGFFRTDSSLPINSVIHHASTKDNVDEASRLPVARFPLSILPWVLCGLALWVTWGGSLWVTFIWLLLAWNIGRFGPSLLLALLMKKAST
jgi:hypothetical protein